MERTAGTNSSFMLATVYKAHTHAVCYCFPLTLQQRLFALNVGQSPNRVHAFSLLAATTHSYPPVQPNEAESGAHELRARAAKWNCERTELIETRNVSSVDEAARPA